jgi:hypothetical protein
MPEWLKSNLRFLIVTEIVLTTERLTIFYGIIEISSLQISQSIVLTPLVHAYVCFMLPDGFQGSILRKWAHFPGSRSKDANRTWPQCKRVWSQEGFRQRSA